MDGLLSEALKAEPAVNAIIDGDEIVYRNYVDVSIAVSAPKAGGKRSRSRAHSPGLRLD